MSPRSLWCDTGIIAALMDAPALSGLDATSATPPSIGTSGLFGWDAGNATAAAVTSTGDGSIAAWDTIWRADHSTAVASGCSADMLKMRCAAALLLARDVGGGASGADGFTVGINPMGAPPATKEEVTAL